MPEGYQSVPVPPEIADEVRLFVERVQEHAGAESGFQKEDIALIEPEERQFDASILATPVLYISATVLASISKTWIETYVTPVIIERLHPPSEKFKKWLAGVVGVKPKKVRRR
jgi:hypothetical protein